MEQTTPAGITLYDYRTREEWLAGRRRGVGASEVAILFGLAPASWGSAYTLWLEKTGRLPRVVEGEQLKWGHYLEPLIANEYATVTKRTLWKGGGDFAVAIDPELPQLFCTPDDWIVEAEGMPGIGDLQIKNAGWYMAREWNDGIPDHVQMQIQTEMACMNVLWGSAAVLQGGNTFRYFDLGRNQNFIDEVREQVRWFWSFVERDTPPPIDGSEATALAIKKLHPDDNGETVDLPPESSLWIADWSDAKEAIAATKKLEEKRKDEAENKLKDAIGDATYGKLPDGRLLSLRTMPRAGYAIAATKYRSLKIEKDLEAGDSGGAPRRRTRGKK